MKQRELRASSRYGWSLLGKKNDLCFNCVLIKIFSQIPDIFGDELEDDNEEIEGDDEILDREDSDGKIPKYHKKKPKIKKTKLKKYVLPLLLAYKMKYFALVPVLIGGLVLLVGATGLAGFFFALFAAVMGLQKGGY